MHRNVKAVIEAGHRLGLDIDVRTFPDGTRTAADAAQAIGVNIAQIVKSLVFSVDGQPVLILVSGANQLDEAKLSRAAGATAAERADADTVRRVTGFPVGGVPPIGLSTELRVFVDEDLLRYDEVWAAAGTPHDVFGLPPQVLLGATRGVVGDLRREGPAPAAK